VRRAHDGDILSAADDELELRGIANPTPGQRAAALIDVEFKLKLIRLADAWTPRR
jgi:hypothetical protein